MAKKRNNKQILESALRLEALIKEQRERLERLQAILDKQP